MNVRLLFIYALMSFVVACKSASTSSEVILKDVLENKFFIGTALNHNHILSNDREGVEVVKKHFNSIVAENCMKSYYIHPEENRYDFTLPDQFVEFGEANNMHIVGHTLIWHSQISPWFFWDENGKEVSADVLKERMREHIHTIVGRYKGRVKGWDVVNEAIEDDGSLRKSKFYDILGEEYLILAFQYAAEADPDAELYYNDFSMYIPAKREGVKISALIKGKGLPD